MEKYLIIIFLIAIQFSCFSQSGKQLISEKYPLSNLIVDSFDYKSLNRYQCKWGSYFIIIKISKNRKNLEMSFSDSIPYELKAELKRLVYLSAGQWDKKYIRQIKSSDYLVQPVLNTFISNCKDTMPYNVKYRGIDSVLEEENYMWKSISVSSARYLTNVISSWEGLLNIENQKSKYLRCIILPPCILKDQKPKGLRRL